ncbi:TetR family transcriptional regulator [Actinorhabdospora filicis]|uniref:TetR family transcriptional regulator n=1 Tax=Actinorhabdospora filicis TaxID=1785913 RepID=A0A9W6SPJ3_9ACTN|nr:TetR family transcriptional regulator [Actinorhabdospora filicis]GLZ80620.1 TetR family transcriptional regulator [Actinorhabdospora filicis]
MGNREALIEGAKSCLLDKGFDRTSVRDIATAAGVSMAAIGYHFGSREKLLLLAVTEILDEWGDISGRALIPDGEDLTPERAYVRMWEKNLEQVREHPRMWLVSMDLFMQAMRNPELREGLAAAMGEGRRGLAAILLGRAEDEVAEGDERGLGMVQMALMSGVAIQALSRPDAPPTGEEVLAGLRALVKLTG